MATMIKHVCNRCGKEFSRRKGAGGPGKFCSRRCVCLATVAGKNKNRQILICPECSTAFEVPVCGVLSRVTCSRKCLAERQMRERKGKFGVGKNNSGWRGGIQTYRRLKKSNCERCGSVKKLQVHHKNEDRYDNRLENLETLCCRCHRQHHNANRRDPKTGRYISLPSDRPQPS